MDEIKIIFSENNGIFRCLSISIIAKFTNKQKDAYLFFISLFLYLENSTQIALLYMTVYDYVWLNMTMYDYLWLSMTMFGYVCPFMGMIDSVLYDYVWLHMTIYDYLWLCLAMYDYVWLCMTIDDYE